MTFHSTHWSVVARANADDRATAQQALGELCEAYWRPMYVYLRRNGRGDDDARELVQAFCARLLEHGGLDGADRATGRFRNYLLGALRNFAANEARAERADKRGGGAIVITSDAVDRCAGDLGGVGSPERAYERRWALDLLARATARLRSEYTEPKKHALFAALEPALLGGDGGTAHADVAVQLGTTDGAVRVALHRLRARMRELVRDEVAQTVADPAEVDDELLALRAALAGGARNPEPSRNAATPAGSWPAKP